MGFDNAPAGTRHVPRCGVDQLGDIRFRSALERALLPSDEYDVKRWLFVPNTYTEYRYILGTRGVKPLICIGVNPSTARPDALDPTLKSVQRIALGNGFDSFIMFNVYAQRATSPDDMDADCCMALHRENLEAFDYILSLSQQPAVWAAWGAVIEKRKYLPQCVRDMAELGVQHGARWFRCGKVSKQGHPHHPLYLKKDEPLVAFDIEAYLTAFQERR
ncbi:MAG: DUF1643 domain-containing protein [Clostridia bacterium]|nr:DUF1643 domain-containing protein [Clostridia bacterium]